jgi:hypothetical protein
MGGRGTIFGTRGSEEDHDIMLPTPRVSIDRVNGVRMRVRSYIK